MRTITALFLLTVFVAGWSEVASSCYHDNECGTGECCAKRIGPLIVSRALQLPSNADPDTVQGKCKPYLVEDQWCGGIWRQNGECGCAPNLHCQHFPDLHNVGRRDLHIRKGKVIKKSELRKQLKKASHKKANKKMLRRMKKKYGATGGEKILQKRKMLWGQYLCKPKA